MMSVETKDSISKGERITFKKSRGIFHDGRNEKEHQDRDRERERERDIITSMFVLDLRLV